MIDGAITEVKNEKMLTNDAQRRTRQTAEKRASESEIEIENVKGAEVTRQDKEDKLEEAISRVVNAARIFDRKIDLTIDKEANIVIVKVIDSETEEVIRQIPPEEMLELARNSEDMRGLLIDTEG